MFDDIWLFMANDEQHGEAVLNDGELMVKNGWSWLVIAGIAGTADVDNGRQCLTFGGVNSSWLEYGLMIDNS